MNNLNQPNVFASGKSENANSVVCELGIKNETIFIKTNYIFHFATVLSVYDQNKGNLGPLHVKSQ